MTHIVFALSKKGGPSTMKCTAGHAPSNMRSASVSACPLPSQQRQWLIPQLRLRFLPQGVL